MENRLKLSELIEHLQRLKEKHGDCFVTHNPYDGHVGNFYLEKDLVEEQVAFFEGPRDNPEPSIYITD